MSPTLIVARKEWRSAFLSPVALVFLGVFLLSSLFVLFYLQGFFARNLAEARPFFEAMPYLLALLTAAFSMRLWSEEARSGTLEVLLTLPVPLRQLVLGKFLAGLALVAVALALTVPVPLVISFLGDLDWGPVLGGYLGLLLLSGAYLALGMLISSLTSNQLVALMMSLLACGLLALLGNLPDFAALPLGVADLLRALGTSSRFESMLRGVLDVRDLAYSLSLAGLFLMLNGLVLERRRWGRSQGGRPRRAALRLGAALFTANLLALNLGLYPQRGLRVDLTEWGEYSLSDVSVSLVRDLPQPLLVRGYFSHKTHPLLAPLVPAVRDFLLELQAKGGERLQVEFLDPTQDEAVEQEAYDKYGVRSVPFRFSDRLEDSVVNAYFHLLVRYGDQVEVLGYKDLIEVLPKGADSMEVRLGNLEYTLARTIQKAAYGFRSLESVCARLPQAASLTLVATEAALPDELREAPARVAKVAGEIQRRCGERFSFRRVDPDRPDSGLSREDLYRRYGLKPMSVSLFDERTFYLDLLLQVGERVELLDASQASSEGGLRKVLTAALQRHTPGFLKTVGLVTPAPAGPQFPGMPAPEGASYRTLEERLRESYEVLPVNLAQGRVPGEVDLLLLVGPRDLGELERFAVDQFLVRGGAVILLAGAYAFEPPAGGDLEVTPVKTGLEEWLASHGVRIEDAVVLDEQNARFPVPVYRQLGGLRLRDIELEEYPPFVLVSPDGMATEHPALQALPALVMNWASPVRCLGEQRDSREARDGKDETPAGPTCTVLFQSSERAWTARSFSAQPDFDRHPELGFALPTEPGERGRVPLAVSLVGRFDSAWKGKAPPVLDAGPPPAGASGEEGADGEPARGRRAGLVERAEGDGRLTVLGSSACLDDVVLALGQEVSDLQAADLQLLSNLVDWSLQDSRLLGIRGKQRYARTLVRLTTGDKLGIELGLFGFAGLAVVLLGVWGLGRRRFARPILPSGPEGR